MAKDLFMGLCVIIVLTICACPDVHAFKLSAKEQRLMNLAYVEGEQFDMAEEMQAILLNESVAGRFGPIGDMHKKDWKHRAYGPFQIRFDTAKWILKREKGYNMSDALLKRLLLEDDVFNTYIAGVYLRYLKRYTKTWEQTVLAYNVGLGNVLKYDTKFDPNNYLAKAKDHMVNTIRDHNKKHFPKQITHKIVKGDTLSKIAIKYYGNWRKWKEIQRLNPNIDHLRLKIGAVIIVR